MRRQRVSVATSPVPGRRAARACLLFAASSLGVGVGVAQAQDGVATPTPRPAIQALRWPEDWSMLADPQHRTQPLDRLKYLPLGPDRDPSLTLGVTLRERLEVMRAKAAPDDNTVLQRLQVDAKVRLNANWNVFVQLEDARAFGRSDPGPADQNRVDLRMAFINFERQTARGALTARAGRQELALDRQRFISPREGPNVRQAFDGVWVSWSNGPWTVQALASQPVQYEDGRIFDDVSNRQFRFYMTRVARRFQNASELSAYVARYARFSSAYPDAAGEEERDVLALRSVGTVGPWDWDAEGMVQQGSVGASDVRAWGGGVIGGYTFRNLVWTPRFSLQADAASGDEGRGDGVLQTFNPLFPNGGYSTRATFTGYANLIHLKPSLTVHPADRLSMRAALAGQWRETTADAIYTQPFGRVPGTTGPGNRWTGAYGQLVLEYALNANLMASVEAVHYEAGAALRKAGRSDTDYLAVELRYAW